MTLEELKTEISERLESEEEKLTNEYFSCLRGIAEGDN